MADGPWTVERVDEPALLVENSFLFDHPVRPAGAQDFLRRAGHVLLLARVADGSGIGFVSGIEMRHPDGDPEMFVYELAVDARWRRRGVAAALLRALGEEALRRGCAGMWTGTERDNVAALATYRSLGADIDDRSVFVTWDSCPEGVRTR
ncbi:MULTISPECIES: GNAT family N-acetyltransferase [Pseudonocardia]|uniref:Aminoglycoside N(6')-acetyltransferase type 1 n=2 Tax=Pseudonocardia TaxID=1847 RepID=A0A1Y2MKV5_PSEAH|nr:MULTISPECIES: GNAT family N-acetyltransferase [Pseudonocardia]OSY35619.1 Aminoglycoside N(6')-acetyltransferase type 1 [Pseudonocardia autotrophica]TDN76910.1 acetyltransferase (GNAT) family protein [Pseudonocardia autotrophica]BBG00913.1 N-acetyltransferase [Pseudonocardia autotrophica]GEC27528.1 N-acetyltransferase [Pseudonocardia saturnea]